MVGNGKSILFVTFLHLARLIVFQLLRQLSWSGLDQRFNYRLLDGM